MNQKLKTLFISGADEEILRRIQSLMTQVDAEFSSLSNSAKDEMLDYHAEGSTLNHCVRWGLNAVDELVADCDLPSEAPASEAPASEAPIFGYYINLDERGDFYADVRDTDGKSIFEINAGNRLGEDESSIFEDGFMRDKNDVAGLTDYLRSLKVIPDDGKVLNMDEFEKQEESRPRMRD